MWSSALDRTIIIVSGEVKFIQIFARDQPSEGMKVKRLPVASENFTNNEPLLGNIPKAFVA